ncbi:hypothetical protein [Treponema pedis]|nr:hypothetical protein [Treponema pedis]
MKNEIIELTAKSDDDIVKYGEIGIAVSAGLLLTSTLLVIFFGKLKK